MIYTPQRIDGLTTIVSAIKLRLEHVPGNRSNHHSVDRSHPTSTTVAADTVFVQLWFFCHSEPQY